MATRSHKKPQEAYCAVLRRGLIRGLSTTVLYCTLYIHHACLLAHHECMLMQYYSLSCTCTYRRSRASAPACARCRHHPAPPVRRMLEPTSYATSYASYMPRGQPQLLRAHAPQAPDTKAQVGFLTKLVDCINFCLRAHQHVGVAGVAERVRGVTVRLNPLMAVNRRHPESTSVMLRALAAVAAGPSDNWGHAVMWALGAEQLKKVHDDRPKQGDSSRAAARSTGMKGREEQAVRLLVGHDAIRAATCTLRQSAFVPR
eukprot:COSAG05_NODE_2139_length_3490_cov_9.342714_4_plen_258_part_00